VIANRLESVRKLVNKLGPVGRLRACYEAGPTGCVLYGQLTQLGVACEVIAPSLVPTKAGDRVKIDHRDATTGALRAGELTAVWVPDASHEALRDLVRAPRSGEKGSTQRAAPGPKNIESGSTATFILTYRRRTLPPVEVMAGATTVLSVQGSLRRAKMRRVLDGCAPLRPDGGCDGAALAGTIPEPARPNPIKRAGLLLAEEAGLTTNPSNYVGPDRSLHIRS
jgi:hypothetical protein